MPSHGPTKKVTTENEGHHDDLPMDCDVPGEPPKPPAQNLDGVTARWAKEEGSDVAWCGSEAALSQALAAAEKRIEIGDLSGDELSSCLAKICQAMQLGRLEQLSLAAWALSDTDMTVRASALPNSGLQALGISGAREVPIAGWRSVWAALPQSITKLDFGENALPDEALADICTAAVQRCALCLEELFLDENQFTNVGPVVGALCALKELSWLDLGDNRLDDLSATKLCDVLPLTKLSCLVLGTNEITAAGAANLFRAAADAQSLEMLYLDHTGTDDSALAVLVGVISQVRLTELHIDSTKVCDAGVQNLCQHLGTSSIDYLDVSENNLTDATIALLSTVLGQDGIQVDEGDIMEDDGEGEGEGDDASRKGKGGQGAGKGHGKGGGMGGAGSGRGFSATGGYAGGGGKGGAKGGSMMDVEC